MAPKKTSSSASKWCCLSQANKCVLTRCLESVKCSKNTRGHTTVSTLAAGRVLVRDTCRTTEVSSW